MTHPLEFSPGSSRQEGSRVATDCKKVVVSIIRRASGSSELGGPGKLLTNCPEELMRVDSLELTGEHETPHYTLPEGRSLRPGLRARLSVCCCLLGNCGVHRGLKQKG